MIRTDFAIATVKDVTELNDGGVAAGPQGAAVLLAEHASDLEGADGFRQVAMDVTNCVL